MAFTVQGLSGALADEPFYWLRLDSEALDRLRAELDACARQERCWYTLIATHDNPQRLRLKQEPTPAFEEDAADVYLRGDILRVTGREGVSCNVAFSSLAAAALSERVRTALARMTRYVEFRVPSRRRNLVEFLPDTALESQETEETRRLGEAGEAAAAEVLPPDDFSDWESAA